MSGKVAELISASKQQLLADGKKSALLGGLFMVLLVVGGRALFFGQNPATVDAASTAVPAVKAAPGGVGSLAPKDPVTPKMRPTPKPPSTAPAAPARRRSTHRWDAGATRPPRAVSIDKLPRTLQRDLFDTIDWSSFALPSMPELQRQDKEDASGQFWRGLAAAISERQEAHRKEQARLDEELTKLELKSTLTGSVPMAYISETLVREGDTINGFSVVRIEDRRVTVRKAGIVCELVMP